MLDGITMQKFMEILSSDSPVPGGGAVSSMSMGLSASLFLMALRISEKSGGQEIECEHRVFLESVAKNALGFADSDMVAFDNVMKAYSLPKETDEEKQRRCAFIQDNLKMAVIVPLKTAQSCYSLVRLALDVAKLVKKSCLSDVITAYYFAEAGFKGSVANVVVNLGSIEDKEFTEEVKKQVEEMERFFGKNASDIEKALRERLSSEVKDVEETVRDKTFGIELYPKCEQGCCCFEEGSENEDCECQCNDECQCEGECQCSGECQCGDGKENTDDTLSEK